MAHNDTKLQKNATLNSNGTKWQKSEFKVNTIEFFSPLSWEPKMGSEASHFYISRTGHCGTLVPCRPKLGHQDLENIGTVSQNHSVCLISLPTKHAGGHKVSSLGGKGGLQWNERFSRVTENWWLSPRSLSGTNLCSYFVRKLSLQKYFFHWDSLSLWQTWSVSSNIRNEILFHTETEEHAQRRTGNTSLSISNMSSVIPPIALDWEFYPKSFTCTQQKHYLPRLVRFPDQLIRPKQCRRTWQKDPPSSLLKVIDLIFVSILLQFPLILLSSTLLLQGPLSQFHHSIRILNPFWC